MANELISLIGAEKVRSDELALIAYSHDATPLFHGKPDLIVAPTSTEDVIKIVKFANEKRIPLIARGAGSNLAGATVPLHGGIVMSMNSMNKILEISKSKRSSREHFHLGMEPLGDAVGA